MKTRIRPFLMIMAIVMVVSLIAACSPATGNPNGITANSELRITGEQPAGYSNIGEYQQRTNAASTTVDDDDGDDRQEATTTTLSATDASTTTDTTTLSTSTLAPAPTTAAQQNTTAAIQPAAAIPTNRDDNDDNDDDDDDKFPVTTVPTSRVTSQATVRETSRVTAQTTTRATIKATTTTTVKPTTRATTRATTTTTVKPTTRTTTKATTTKSPTRTTTSTVSQSTRLSAYDARAMVRNRFRINNLNGIIEKIEYTYDANNPMYKGEAVNNNGGRVVFELNARTRTFSKWSPGNDNSFDDYAHALPTFITMDEAAKLVIQRTGVSTAFVQKIDFKYDGNTTIYQGEAFTRGYKYSFELYAVRGKGFHKFDPSGGDETWAKQYYNVR